MKISGILLFLLSGCLIHVMGQETVRFHADPNIFIQDARNFFGFRQPEESRAVLLRLETAQKKGQLEENHWIDLSGKANAMIKSDTQSVSDLFLLIDAFLEAATHTRERAGYLIWSAFADKLLIQNQKDITQVKKFMKFTLDYSRNGILYKSSAFEWGVKPDLNIYGIDSTFYVIVNAADLVARGSGDSTVIFSTRGRYYPETNHFFGEGGKVSWEKVKIPSSQVCVNLNKYTLDLKKSFYEIDSVNLIDRRYFKEPLMGRIENKILPGVSAETAGYPKFTSYDHRNRIKNLYPGMDYEGGFALYGSKVFGIGPASAKSILTVFRNQKPIIRLASTYFSFLPDQARGINSEVSIYLETDSIYHPGLLFQYNGKQKEISFIRDGQGLSPSRFIDSYHEFDLNVDWIRWTIGSNFISMAGLPGSLENKASFESADFFNIDRYNEILIVDKTHPVAAVKKCSEYYYSRTFTLEDLSKFMVKPQHLVEEMLLRLSFLGFVRYNSETKIVDVQERAFDFLKKNAGQQDYDVIRFESVLQQPEVNAILNLTDNHLKVIGLKSLELSQTRQVTIYPTNASIEILKGRDLLFDGEIQGGLIRFYGKKFHFNYDDFSIRLDEVGKLKIQVYEKPKNKNQTPVLADVTSVIEYTKGTLKIDEPSNKSGLRADKYPEYPILQTDTNAYVYYNQKEILNGVYPRETFNFSISPFTLRGLNLYTFSDSLNFPGRLTTAGIFPPLELALRHQSDHSLGFETLKTPEEGYPVYNGKGRFYNSIAMSKAGLRGSGRLEYLNSAVESDDILFLPDQVNTLASIAVAQDSSDTGNPETRGEKMAIKWYPGGDKLVAQSTKGPLNMYGKGKFDGVLNLEPNGLIGKGTVYFDGYSITSNEIKFNENTYQAPNSILRIFRDSAETKADKTPYPYSGTLMQASQFNGMIDVANKKAHFEPAGTQSRIEFTQNRFEGKPARFDWDMDKKQLVMEDLTLKMARKPSDSLNFKSGQAEFSLQDQLIRAHSVDFIDVADVRIFPADRNMVIRTDAKIDSLMQATIVSKDSSLIHRINSATVTIVDKKNYHASGNYQYRDVAGREFAIRFSDIQPDKNGISTGKGDIPQESEFSLSPAFKYYGNVEWNNKEPLLLFNGQTQLSHSCPNITLQWIKFNSRIYPDSVAIPIDSITTNDKDERLFKGFFLSNQPVELYSTFVGPHTRYSDQPLISAKGWLWYDEPKGQYKLASDEKRKDPEADGPILFMDANTCKNEAKGQLTFGVDLGQVKLSGAGKFVHDLKADSIRGTVLMTSDFFIDEKLLNFMASAINNASGLEAVNYSKPEFRSSFKDLLGRATGEELLKQISLTGKWKKIPDQLLHTIVFSDVNFKWNPETGSYQSEGKIGIGNIMGEPINKKIKGFMEILHRRGGDVWTMYLELDRQNYFFLTYSRGVMQCVAGPGQEKFNTIIRSTKDANRTQKILPGEPEYQYYIGTYAQVSEFLRRFSVDR
jgi:hypothetical protein